MTTRILVIDDEPLICRLVAYQLGGNGYIVQTCSSAHEALQNLGQEQPDLVLLDVMMPEISGYDLCRQIRSYSNVPVIMLTAKHGDDDIVAGLTIGADDYIGKPFSEQQLVARIEAVLRRSRPGHERIAPSRAGNRTQLQPPPAVCAEPPAQPAQPVSSPTPAPPRPASPKPALPRLGPRMAEARRQRNMSLHEAERSCGVRWEFLQAIEQEQFSFVPRSDLRHALRSYSAMLGIDLQPYIGARARRRSLRSTMALAAIIGMLIVLTLLVLVM